MQYKNAKSLLPEWLLATIQKYAEGELIYIPRKETIKAKWGEANGTRQMYHVRNMEIVSLYRRGTKVCELAKVYNLSEYSIRKIVTATKPEEDIRIEMAR
jgi:Mor family transcriptional regulator